ncbi:MAG: 8-oxoguanine DNA glycosylase [Planctomycetes bacterium]|nr:8-oxoguanine DNA glycosylase [Planctomycetota bacterium]
MTEPGFRSLPRDEIRVEDFDLAATLECGQFFRCAREDRPDGTRYLVWTRDRLFRCAQSGDRLAFDGIAEAGLRRFFSLDEDHAARLARLGRDPRLAPVLDRYRGVRLIRQDPWECLVSYICSAYSNIPRIRQNVQGLAERFGRPIVFDGVASHAFPEPGAVREDEQLSALRLGYRRRYVAAAFRTVTDAFLAGLRGRPYAEAKAALLALDGVGDKVVECVLLFGLGFGEAFPVDVHIRRILRRLYHGGRRVTDRRLREAAQRRWGADAGWAQQCLFAARSEFR